MKIVVAEDDLEFLELLQNVLPAWGYEVVPAQDGIQAWEILQQKDAPMMAIVDWRMPGMDGLEICRRVRSEPAEPYHYLILCTSQREEADLVAGMEAGADDYIAKPIRINELRARLNAGRRIVELQNEVVAEREKVAAQAAELAAANKDLEAFGYAVSNDILKSLLSIGDAAKSIEGIYCMRQDDQCRTFTQRIYKKTKDLAQLIGLMHEFFRPVKTELRREVIDLSAIAGKVADRLRMRLPERNVTFRVAPEVMANADPSMMEIVLENLFDNAIKHTARKPEPLIQFGVAEVNGKQAYYVRDNGEGFSDERREKLFQPFQGLTGNGESVRYGIGLAKVERIVRRHGGKVWAEGKPGEGATFYFTL